LSDLDAWEFVDDEDAKMTIRAAVQCLLKGTAGSDRGDILTEIAEIVRESALGVSPDQPDPFDEVPPGG
jgi:hypothetical protein